MDGSQISAATVPHWVVTSPIDNMAVASAAGAVVTALPPTPSCVLHTLARPTRHPHRCSNGVVGVHRVYCRRSTDAAASVRSVATIAFRVADRWLTRSLVDARTHTYTRERARASYTQRFLSPDRRPVPVARVPVSRPWFLDVRVGCRATIATAHHRCTLCAHTHTHTVPLLCIVVVYHHRVRSSTLPPVIVKFFNF